MDTRDEIVDVLSRGQAVIASWMRTSESYFVFMHSQDMSCYAAAIERPIITAIRRTHEPLVVLVYDSNVFGQKVMLWSPIAA